MPHLFLKRVLATGLFGSVSLLSGAFAQSDQPPAPELKPLQTRQEQLGTELQRSADDIREIVNEVRQNFEVEFSGKEKLNAASSTLDRVSNQRVPDVNDALHRASAGAQQAQTGLRDGLNGTTGIVQDLGSVLGTIQQSVKSSAAEHALASAVRAEEEAYEKTRTTRAEHEKMEGKTPEKLTPEERTALRETAEQQEKAREAIERAMSALREGAKEHDPAAAEPARKALEGMEHADVPKLSAETKEDINGNHLRAAEEKHERILAALHQAETKLGKPTDHPASELEHRLSELKTTREAAEEAARQTEKLNPNDDPGMAAALKKQGEVAKALNTMKHDNPELGKAEEHARKASDELGDNHPAAAHKDQQAVLDTLNKEISKAESALAQARNSNGAQKTSATGAALGTMETERVAGPAAWNVALPPKDRADVEQAQRSPMPAKYARQIKLYYENLAGAN